MSETVVAPPKIDVEWVVITEEELEKPFKVFIHNDDVTPMDFVLLVLIHFFELSPDRAYEVMLHAHNSGEAYVATFPRKEAEKRVFEAQYAARQNNYPLTFSIEPDE
jgi:ATP-dependent Clp protease adaptor protein ClpS